MRKKIYIDFDGVISNTIKTIVDMYNEDFQYYTDYRYINWIDVESWGFDELNCTNREYINTYFNQPRFFEKLTLMDNSEYAFYELLKDYDITIVSMGNTPNLRLKCKWVEKNLPYCQFIGCDFDNYKDKSHIDMSGAVFIDDSSQNLKTSNAYIKICFGDDYEWNNGWKGIRCYNWIEVLRKLKLEL